MSDQMEMYDVVDSLDRVIGTATRREIHQKGLLHRSVHILVFNSKGELYLQKRSLNKDENPGYWDTSAAGHVNAGEDYMTSAHRELEEELGIRAELQEIGRFTACPETFGEHVRIYTCVSDATIVINPREIIEGRFWTFDEIDRALVDPDIPFTSTFGLILDTFHEIIR